MDDETLAHEYDAAKRREYYLRTRHLKGRRRGAAKSTKPHTKSRAEIARERHAHLEQQVNELKARLQKLQAALKVLVAQAKKRSGVKPTKQTATKKTAAPQQKSHDSKPQKLTAAQKKAKAEAEKKARREQAVNNGTASNSQLSEELKSLNERIKTMQARIEKMRKSGAIGSQTTNKK